MNYKEYIKYLLESFTPKQIQQLMDKFKLENNLLTDTQIKHYIDVFDNNRNNPKIENKDIFSYTFKELEKLIDSFSMNRHRKEGETVVGETIYQEGSISVYEAPNRESCINIGKGEKWCVSRKDASNMYNTYRYKVYEPNFYFIKNTELTNTDRWSFFVLMPFNTGKYGLASRENTSPFTGSEFYTWEQVVSSVPFLKDLKYLFKSKPLTDEERRVFQIVNREVGDSNLLTRFESLYLVEMYISMGHELSIDQFENLNNPELRMKYINLGHEIDDIIFQQLTEPEMKRYLITNVERNNGILNLYHITDIPNSFKLPEFKQIIAKPEILNKIRYSTPIEDSKIMDINTLGGLMMVALGDDNDTLKELLNKHDLEDVVKYYDDLDDYISSSDTSDMFYGGDRWKELDDYINLDVEYDEDEIQEIAEQIYDHLDLKADIMDLVNNNHGHIDWRNSIILNGKHYTYINWGEDEISFILIDQIEYAVYTYLRSIEFDVDANSITVQDSGSIHTSRRYKEEDIQLIYDSIIEQLGDIILKKEENDA
jgi:hypothetical protein